MHSDFQGDVVSKLSTESFKHSFKNCLFFEIDDLTLMVISYEIYENSLWRVPLISYEMTTSVRFCISYDPLKRAVKMSDVTCRAKRL